MGEEKKKRHWKRKLLFLGAAIGAITALVKRKKGSTEEAGWEEAKPSAE